MWAQRTIKHGNALAIVIPAKVCRAFDLKRGDFLFLRINESDRLEMEFLDPKKQDEVKSRLGVNLPTIKIK